MKRKKPIIRTAISSILIALILVVVIVANSIDPCAGLVYLPRFPEVEKKCG